MVNTYFDTRGSYRRTAKNIDKKVRYARIYAIVDTLGENCKSPFEVAKALKPSWSGFLGLDGKVIKISGEKFVLLLAVDLGTQDIVDAWLAEHEDYHSIRPFVREIKKEIGYEPKLAVIDLDRAWKEVVSEIYPDVPIQYCVVHFERIFDREIPLRNRTEKQHELKSLVRKVLYAPNLDEAKEALQEILFSRKGGYFRDRKLLKMIRSLQDNFDLLTTHFRITGSFRDNNRTESVIDKIHTRIYPMRGYKTKRTAQNSLKLIVMHYRFNPFEACKDSERNGKCPLNFAGIDTSKMDWISYSQKDPSMLRVL